MDGLRSDIVAKTSKFIKRAQQVPPPAPGAPAPTPPPGGAPPGGGAVPPPMPKPPMPTPGLAPGAPLPKSREEMEGDVQKKIEREKRDEAKLDTLGDDVSEVKDQLKTMTEALIQMKRVIEKFKVMKEKESEGGMTKMSPEDFGLDKKNLIVSTEDRMINEADKLRLARKERISNLEESMNLPKEKDYKQNVVPPSVDKKPKEDTIPDMFKLLALELSDDGNQWSLFNKKTNEVYYTIDASTSEDKETFKTKKFAEGIVHDIKDLGLDKAMDKYKGKPMGKPDEKHEEKHEEKPGDHGDKKVLLKMPKKEDVKDKIEDKIEDKKDLFDHKGALSDVKRRFIRAFRLALTAQKKNLIDNPLKAAWFDSLKSLDIGDPTHLIEAVFSKASDDQFEVALQKTEELLGMTDEAFVEAESMIGQLDTSFPKEAPVTASTKTQAEELRRRATAGSLPVNTQTTENENKFSYLSDILPRPRMPNLPALFKS
jgi:hypothetical protein